MSDKDESNPDDKEMSAAGILHLINKFNLIGGKFCDKEFMDELKRRVAKEEIDEKLNICKEIIFVADRIKLRIKEDILFLKNDRHKYNEYECYEYDLHSLKEKLKELFDEEDEECEK